MVPVLLWEGIALASFAAAGALVFAIVRLTEHLVVEAGGSRAGRWLRRRSEPAWWPEFERAFADYVGDRRRL